MEAKPAIRKLMTMAGPAIECATVPITKFYHKLPIIKIRDQILSIIYNTSQDVNSGANHMTDSFYAKYFALHVLFLPRMSTLNYKIFTKESDIKSGETSTEWSCHQIFGQCFSPIHPVTGRAEKTTHQSIT